MYPTRSVLAKILILPLESVRVIFVRGSGCYGRNGADAASFDAAILSPAVGRPVRLRFSRKDEMVWENFGVACAIEQRAGLAPDGHIVAWDRQDRVTSLGSRPGYDRPGNVISWMLLGYEPEPLQPGPAKSQEASFVTGATRFRPTSLHVSEMPAAATEVYVASEH